MPLESFHSFPKLAIELQNLIWEETLPQPRIFDGDTLRLANPQNGIICSYLTPYALYICSNSRTFALSRLCRSVLLRGWPQNTGRIVYFNPDRDICTYKFTDLSWRNDFIPGRCLFSCIEIVASVDPQRLTSTSNYGLRSVEFRDKFPNLKHIIVRDRDVNLYGSVLRNGWTQEQWIQESSVSQGKWDLEWKEVQEFFEKRNVSISISPTAPEPERAKKEFIANFPTWRIPLPDSS